MEEIRKFTIEIFKSNYYNINKMELYWRYTILYNLASELRLGTKKDKLCISLTLTTNDISNNFFNI